MKWLSVLLVLSTVSLATWYVQNVNDHDGGHVSLAMDDNENLFIAHGNVFAWLDYSYIAGWGNIELETEPSNWFSSVAANGFSNVHTAWSHNSELIYCYSSGPVVILDSACHGPTSIALNENDFPAIAYYGDTDIKYISWDGSQWNGDVVDSECGGSTVSLAFNNSNQPLIAYASIMGFLKLAHWNGNQWDITTIDSGGDFLCEGISLKLDSSGNLHIVCRKNMDLCYYQYDGSQWSSEVIDQGLCTPLSSASITLDDFGDPHIAYNSVEESTSTIVYFYNDGSSWTREELEPGSYPSIIIDGSGDPAIAYGVGEEGVKYLTHNTVGIFGEPASSELLQGIYPNPASTAVYLDIVIEGAGNVNVTLCDLSGRVIHRQDFTDLQQGASSLEVGLDDVPSGIYICRISSSNCSAGKLLTVLR